MITEKKILDQLEYYKVLDEIKKYCHTELGKSEIINLLPSYKVDVILKESTYVSEAKNILIEQDIPPIEYLPNMKETVSRSAVEGSVLSVKQIYDILKLAQVSRKLYQYLKSNAVESTITSDFAHSLFVDKIVEHQISSIFTDSGDIRDNASDKLRDIRRQIIEKSDQLRKSVNRILKKLSETFVVQDEYVTLRDGRIVVPIKAEHKRHVRGFIHSESASGQTVYIEPEETLDLNNEILSLSFAETREIDRILRSLTGKIGSVSRELNQSLYTIGKIDSIFAKARYSTEIIGSFPSIEDTKPFEVISGRHPLLIRKLRKENTVPLNIKIESEKVVLITGPNAGGKTVVLKTLGLFSLMIQAGLHIPADPDSNFRLFKNILMDIGDQQSIEDDLSTFSSHLGNINDVLNRADDKSLILVDEIGTGTDPAEGSALATAILIKMRDTGALVFATTHHGNLKIIANELDGFQNASMLFDSAQLRPTYVFSQGMPGSSYAFEVAKRIGLSRELIDLAVQYLDTSKSKVEDFLLDLEKKSNDLKEKLNYYERENVRLKGLMNLYSDKVNKLETEKKEILRKTKVEAELYLKDVNKKIESAIKNIKESQAEKSTVKFEKQKIEEIKNHVKEIVKKTEEKKTKYSDKVLKIGDTVKITGTETIGELIELDGDRAILLSGSIKVLSKLNKLEFTSHKSIERTARNEYSIAPQIESLRLDIRGKKPEEVEFEIIRYIDDAYSNDLQNIEILHGKGNGVLKKLVHELLKKHEAVKNYYFAQIEFGGEGITIVELK